MYTMNISCYMHGWVWRQNNHRKEQLQTSKIKHYFIKIDKKGA